MLAKEKFEIFPTCSPLLKPARLLIFTNISSLLAYYILLANFWQHWSLLRQDYLTDQIPQLNDRSLLAYISFVKIPSCLLIRACSIVEIHGISSLLAY